MREILFRGKSAVNGEWVIGNYFKTIICGKEVHCIMPNSIFVDRKYYQIVPETRCEFTGLTDRNGRKIFEGDILKFMNDDGEYSYYTVTWEANDYTNAWTIGYSEDLLDKFICERSEVVGNVHDNPEMVEK